MIPVVAECDDSFLNDCRRMQVTSGGRAGGVRRGPRLPRRRPAADGGRGRVRAPACRAWGSRAASAPSSRVTPDGPHRRRAADDQLRAARPADRRRRTRRPAASARPPEPSRPARRLLHRRRRHRRAGRRRRPAPGWPGGSGWGWPAPARPPTTAAARSSWRPARPPGPTATGHPRPASDSPAGPSTRCSRPSSTPPRRRCSTRCCRRPPRSVATATPARASTADVVATAAGVARCLTVAPAQPRRGPDPDGGRRRARRDAVPPRHRPSRSRACWRRCPTARTTSPRRTPRATAQLRDEHEYAVCRVDLRGTGSSGGRRDRRVPTRRADGPRRGHRLAGRPGLVRRQRRHVRHVVLRLQRAPDRLRAAAGAEGDLRDLRQRRPVERRRALARRPR